MRYSAYTRDELEALPLNKLRSIDIQTVQEEMHVQTLINKKLSVMPVVGSPLIFPASRTDAIKTLEQEQALQKEMDEYNDMMKRNTVGEEFLLEQKIETLQEEVAKIEQEIVQETPAVFCQFCDSKGVRHKKVCTREVVTA